MAPGAISYNPMCGGLKTYEIGLLSVAWALAAGLTDVRAAPRDAPISTSWQFDVTVHDPQRITLTLPGDSQPSTFWYMLYTVTNNTGQDQYFYPSFRFVTDTLAVVEGGANVSPAVYQGIAARHRGQYPFMQAPMDVTGLLLQGQANRRTSVAIFHDFDRKAKQFTCFASGFSGEIKRISNPTFDPKRGESDQNRRSFILRRTMAITYDLPGDARTRDRATPVRRSRKWVMR